MRVDTAPDGSKRYVLLDAQGPGAVVRIWSATPAGTLRIYLDGDSHPAVEAPFEGLLRGEVAPFVAPLAHVTARGYNLYFPIPYRSRCLVTVDSIVSLDPFSGRPTAKLYYQIGYRTYPATAAARVRPYDAAEVTRALGTLGRVAAVLRDGPPAVAPRPGRAFVEIPAATISAGHPATTVIAAPPGRRPDHRAAPGHRRTKPRAARRDDADDRVRRRRDRSGAAGGVLRHRRRVERLRVAADDRRRRRHAELAVRHAFRQARRRHDRQPGPGLTASGRAVVDARPFGPDALLFHAGWRPRAVLATRPFSDWHVGTLDGTGHQVGTMLDVENPPGVAWWGEGDEKISVDAEPFPSLFGTGTEDYFGYAWSTPEPFAHAYHAQTRAPGQGFGGFFSMNRFHVLDPIPFARSLRFDLEIWHWTDTAIAADALLYWYARPGGHDDFPRAAP